MSQSEKQEQQVPESAFEIAPPNARQPDNKVTQEVVLASYSNYPPLIKHMHFSLKTLPPITKEKILVLWILHLLMIIGPLWNIVLCIIEVITGGIKQPVLKLILSIIFFFFWTVTGYFHFYHGHRLITQLRGSAVSYYISAFIIALKFLLWSIFDWGDANGFIAMIRLFTHGNILCGVFSIIYILLTLPVAVLATIGAVFVYRR